MKKSKDLPFRVYKRRCRTKDGKSYLQKKYSMRFSFQGKEYYFTLCGDKSFSYTMAADKYNDVVRGTHDAVTNDVKVKALLKDYLKEVKLKKRASHFKFVTYMLTAILKGIKCAAVENINEKIVNNYIELRIEEVSPRTVNGEVAALKTMLTWGAKAQLIKDNPIENIALVEEKAVRPRRALTPEEVAALLDNSGKYRLLWFTILSTGLRKKEAVNLTWGMIDFAARVITIPPELDKTGRRTYARMPLEVSQELQRVRRAPQAVVSRYVFRNANGRPYNNSLLKAFNRCLDRAGIPKYKSDNISNGTVDIHALRTTFISSLVNAGLDPKTVQVLARHRRLATTLKYYVKPFASSVRSAVEKLPFLRTNIGQAKKDRALNADA